MISKKETHKGLILKINNGLALVALFEFPKEIYIPIHTANASVEVGKVYLFEKVKNEFILVEEVQYVNT